MNDLIKEEIIKKHPYNVWQGKGKDKRWRTYIPDKTNKYGRKLIIKPDEESIYQWLNDFYKEELIADLLDKVNLEVFYYEWLKYKRLHTTASTYITRIESDWKTFYVGTPIVKIPLKNINKLTLDIWAHQLIKEHDMTRKKYVNVQVIMRQALSYAVDLDIIKSNPMETLKIDKRIFRKEQKKPDNTQVFTFDERKQIVALAWEDFKNSVKFYELSPLALAFQFQTGLRIGELCAVRFSDIENGQTRFEINSCSYQNRLWRPIRFPVKRRQKNNSNRTRAANGTGRSSRGIYFFFNKRTYSRTLYHFIIEKILWLTWNIIQEQS